MSDHDIPDKGEPVRTEFVLVEHKTASDRSVVPGIGILLLTGEEAGEMNKRMVRSMVRVYPLYSKKGEKLWEVT